MFVKHDKIIRTKEGERAKTGWLGIRIMCLSTDCCFSELALKKLTKRVDLLQSGPRHHLIEM
jgi:hypothetical protein